MHLFRGVAAGTLPLATHAVGLRRVPTPIREPVHHAHRQVRKPTSCAGLTACTALDASGFGDGTLTFGFGVRPLSADGLGTLALGTAFFTCAHGGGVSRHTFVPCPAEKPQEVGMLDRKHS